MKVRPEIESAYRTDIVKATGTLKAVLGGYILCYEQVGTPTEELQELINGTYSGIIGFLTQSFDEARCKKIFELLLETKREIGKKRGV
jgi:hypothetical protein